MAIYEYEILNSDGTVRGILEVEQKMSEAPLVRHPETGEPLRRILSATFARGSEGADLGGGCATGACGVGGGSYGGCSSGSCDWN